MVALCQAPFLLDDPNVGLLFPADAIARAKHYLSLAPGGLGNIIYLFLSKKSFLVQLSIQLEYHARFYLPARLITSRKYQFRDVSNLEKNRFLSVVLYMLLLVHSHTSTLTQVLSDQVLTVIPVVSLELGRRLLTSSRGVMDIRGQIGPVC